MVQRSRLMPFGAWYQLEKKYFSCQVDLEGNRLTSVSPSFGDLKQLKYLFLGDNRVTSLPVDIFDKICKSLKALSVSGNQLDAFPRDSLQKCATLSHLNLGYNQVKFE